jgi:hypothetical protein
MNYNISLSNDSLTAVFTGGTSSGVRIHTINSSHPSWQSALEVIKSHGSGEELEKLMSVKESIIRFSQGKITVSDNEVLYDGKPVHGFVVCRILDFVKNGFPYQPLVKFLERVRLNPSSRSVEELYKFLEHRKMPITPNGTFLAYKSVRADYTDHHTGKVSNKVGDIPARFERNQVDDDPRNGCSYGYHVGSMAYAESFGGGERHLMIVEVDPADVVSVPYDCDCQKLRCVGYKVVDEFKHILDDNYSTEYHSVGSNDGDDGDGCYEGNDDSERCDSESCDSEEEISVDEEDAYHIGYEAGYGAGVNGLGFDNSVNADDDEASEIIANVDELYESYKLGYQRGYDRGVRER